MTKKQALEQIVIHICNEGEIREDKTYHFCENNCMNGDDECPIKIAIKAIISEIERENNERN